MIIVLLTWILIDVVDLKVIRDFHDIILDVKRGKKDEEPEVVSAIKKSAGKKNIKSRADTVLGHTKEEEDFLILNEGYKREDLGESFHEHQVFSSKPD